MPDAFGRAIRDHHRGDRTTPLRQGDGEETREHPIGAFYFDAFDAESNAGSWLTSRLSGPLVDLGAGGPARALRFQGRFETVAVETSPALVEAMRDRGVVDVREGDMFALRDARSSGIGSRRRSRSARRSDWRARCEGSRHFSATSRS